MDTVIKSTKRKVIDIPDNVFRYLSVKAAAKGTNLKNYIENLLAKDVEDMDDSQIYSLLLKNRPEGRILADENEKEEFLKWLDE